MRKTSSQRINVYGVLLFYNVEMVHIGPSTLLSSIIGLGFNNNFGFLRFRFSGKIGKIKKLDFFFF